MCSLYILDFPLPVPCLVLGRQGGRDERDLGTTWTESEPAGPSVGHWCCCSRQGSLRVSAPEGSPPPQDSGGAGGSGSWDVHSSSCISCPLTWPLFCQSSENYLGFLPCGSLSVVLSLSKQCPSVSLPLPSLNTFCWGSLHVCTTCPCPWEPSSCPQLSTAPSTWMAPWRLPGDVSKPRLSTACNLRLARARPGL